MFRTHRATILAILLCGVLGIAAGAVWVWATGRRDIPPLVVIGLALAAGGITALVDSLTERRRTRVAHPVPVHRHRKAHVR
ncbi:hypothetical protein [Streptomyces sp. NPDC018584]|uniref:hypothetical protein n=1 Tax=unclassified Streptomyces TaxID=2593676 RepID=UPI00379A786F